MPVELIKEHLLPFANITAVARSHSDIVIDFENKKGQKFDSDALEDALKKIGWFGGRINYIGSDKKSYRISKLPPENTFKKLQALVSKTGKA